MKEERPNDARCEHAHQHLLKALALLDTDFRGPERRAMRAMLIERATVACANARLRRHDDLRADLQRMLNDALAIPAGQADEPSVARLRGLIRTALGDEAE